MQNNVKRSGNWVRMLRQMAAFTLFLFATTAYSASKTVLVLGDSLSAEYGLNRGSGWVPLLEKRLKAEKIDASIVNASISGETTGGGRSRLPALLERHRPDVVVIELGANDGLRGLPLSAAEANLRTMITVSRTAKAKVLLVGMQLPPNYGKEYTEKFISLFSNLAQSTRTPLVPFLLHGIAEQSHMFQSDRIHPAAEAQPIMLDNVWPFLKPLLTK